MLPLEDMCACSANMDIALLTAADIRPVLLEVRSYAPERGVECMFACTCVRLDFDRNRVEIYSIARTFATTFFPGISADRSKIESILISDSHRCESEIRYLFL